MHLIPSFDIIRYLDSRGISYEESGKNISRAGEWIGVQCPFCGDHSNHLGINLQSRAMSCWRCGKRHLISLICQYEKGDMWVAERILREFQDRSAIENLNNQALKSFPEQTELPRESTKTFSSLHSHYLQSRGFDPDSTISKYDLYATHNIGAYKFRLIIPVYFNGGLVNYTSRDITDKSNLPYKTCPDDQAVRPIKSCLYNWDTVTNTVIVVEGPLDAWKIGDGCVATFGKVVTKQQLALLIKVKRVFVMFDSDASLEAARLVANLSTVVDKVETIFLREGDPADLDDTAIQWVRDEVFT